MCTGVTKDRSRRGARSPLDYVPGQHPDHGEGVPPVCFVPPPGRQSPQPRDHVLCPVRNEQHRSDQVQGVPFVSPQKRKHQTPGIQDLPDVEF